VSVARPECSAAALPVCALDAFHITLPCIHLSFFNDPPPTATYTLSLHDALPIYQHAPAKLAAGAAAPAAHWLW